MPVLSVPVVPGIEGRHTWDGALTLGDLSVWPRFRIDQITGLHSRADFEARSEPAVGRLGELPRRSFLAGKTVVYEGRVQARDLDELRLGEGQLQAAFAVDDERELISAQHPDYGPDSFRWEARCLTLELGDRQTTRRYERAYAIALRQSDPRYYGITEDSGETQEFVTGAGESLPFTLPLVLPATAASGSATLNVGGSAPTDPVIEFHGPVTSPRATNQTLGVELRFSPGFAIANGSWVEVDFEERTVKLEGTTLVTAEPDLIASDWWDAGVEGLAPGQNVISYTGDEISDPAKLVIRWRPAHW